MLDAAASVVRPTLPVRRHLQVTAGNPLALDVRLTQAGITYPLTDYVARCQLRQTPDADQAVDVPAVIDATTHVVQLRMTPDQTRSIPWRRGVWALDLRLSTQPATAGEAVVVGEVWVDQEVCR